MIQTYQVQIRFLYPFCHVGTFQKISRKHVVVVYKSASSSFQTVPPVRFREETIQKLNIILQQPLTVASEALHAKLIIWQSIPILKWRSALKCTLYCSDAGCLLNHWASETAKVLGIVEFVSFICFPLKNCIHFDNSVAFRLFTGKVSVGT